MVTYAEQMHRDWDIDAVRRILVADKKFVAQLGSAATTDTTLEVDVLGDAIDWTEFAQCQNTDPEIFFPEKGGSAAPAKRICGRCAVKSECLEYALKSGEPFGIWGGVTERVRRKMQRRVE